MKGIINNWHNISVYLAGAIFLIVAFFVSNELHGSTVIGSHAFSSLF